MFFVVFVVVGIILVTLALIWRFTMPDRPNED
jgi:phage shock protein PspC (stress-responsive transcriptional regulator)